MTTAQATALQYGFLGFLAVWATLLIPQLLLQLSQYGRVHPGRIGTTAALTLYACLVLALVVLPLPSPGEPRLSQTVQLVPLQWVSDVLRASAANPLETLAFQQLAMNVLLFVPLGIFARLLWRRRFSSAVTIGLAASALIEITQGTANFGTAPYAYRIFDVDDLMSNTTGAALGWILAALFVLLRALTVASRHHRTRIDPPRVTLRKLRATPVNSIVNNPLSARTAGATDVLPVPTTVRVLPRPAAPTVPVYAGHLAAAHAGPGGPRWPQQR